MHAHMVRFIGTQCDTTPEFWKKPIQKSILFTTVVNRFSLAILVYIHCIVGSSVDWDLVDDNNYSTT